MTHIAVTIPSYRRPRGLTRLLFALERLDTKATLSVIVGDNDPSRSEALRTCETFRRSDYRWPLDAFPVPERGLAAVRNAVFERALAIPGLDYIAMLDDDECPEPDWLDALIAMQRQTGADAVGGAVLREFDEPPPLWALALDGVAPIRHHSGAIASLSGAGNALITRACLEKLPRPFFDARFTLSGGEDSDFFQRLRQSGARFAWADNAVVREHVPPSRLDRRWLLQRAYSIGNSDMRVALKYRQGLPGEIAKIVGAFCALPEAALPSRRIPAMARAFRAAGKLDALRGRVFNAYATVDGQ